MLVIREEHNIRIAKDNLTDPKLVKFSDEKNEVDLTKLKDHVNHSGSYPTGTFPLNLASITNGLFLFIRADKDLQILIDGQFFNFKANKSSKLWLSFSTVSLVIASVTEVEIIIAGDHATPIPIPPAVRTNYVYVFKDAAYTAQHFDDIFTDSSAAAIPITLPLNPAVGDRIKVSDLVSAWATNNVTLLRNGKLIDGIADDLVLDTNGESVELVFTGDDYGWFIR